MNDLLVHPENDVALLMNGTIGQFTGKEVSKLGGRVEGGRSVREAK